MYYSSSRLKEKVLLVINSGLHQRLTRHVAGESFLGILIFLFGKKELRATTLIR